MTSRANWDAAYAQRHTHANKGTLDAITDTLVSNWNTASTNAHTHGNKTVIDGITSTLVSSWNTAYGWGNHAAFGYAKSTDLNSYMLSSKIGSANGVAPLGSDGLISSSYLPSYVDDVLEYSAFVNLPTIGEAGKIYVVTSTNLTYRWSGTSYVEISASLALGETSSTAYAGAKGKVNRDNITALRAITISAGTGLTGGGDLSSNRAFALAQSGVTAGTFTKLTVDVYGRVIVGSTLVESDIPTLSIGKTNGLQTNLDSRALKTIAILAGTGLVGGGDLNSNRTISLGAVGTAGTYTKVTTDVYGRITSGAALIANDIPSLAIPKITGL